MGPGAWLLFLGLSAVAGTYAVFLYARREVPVAGRVPLAVLRAASLVLVLLLLFDPSVPAFGSGSARFRDWVLLDGSLSMAVPVVAGSPEGGRLWDTALARAREAASGGAEIVVFGDGLGPPGVDGALPGHTRSRLTEALERAAESGARRVRLLSDLRFEDPVAAKAAVDRLGLDLVVEPLGDLPGGASPRPGPTARSAGIEAFRVPRAVRAGEGVDVEATVFATGAAGETATVEVSGEGTLLTSMPVVLPGEGRLVSVRASLPAPGDSGRVRYMARVSLAGDAFPDDDERIGYTTVDPVEGNLVLVSLRPDWEHRFLLPVLERVTGLPARGFVRVGEDRFLAMAPEGAGGTVPASEVALQAAGAAVLVFQGAPAADAGEGDWAREVVDGARRALLLPGTREGAEALGLDVAPARAGEWYASTELPPSPLAGELASAEIRSLPPVTGVLPLVGQPDGFVPLELRLRGTGPAEAALVLRVGEDGYRRAVVLAEGFWRWAFRGPELHATYDRLWSGVAGWLLAAEAPAGGPGVRPEDPVVPRGRPVAWSAAGGAGGEVHLTVSRGDSTFLDTVLEVPSDGRFETPALPPGSYTYRASSGGSDQVAAREGRFDVEAYTDELLHPPLTELASLGSRDATGDRPLPGRPLRTHPAPYLLLLALLCAEWIGRRRQGLR